LSVNATPYKPPTAPIPQDVSGIYPSVVSSQDADVNGLISIHVKGNNFNAQSRVLLDGNEVSGVTSYGKATGSQTTFISSQELLFTFPANPILNSTGHSIVQVITPVSNQGTTQTAGVYMHTETIAPGTYTIAKNSRQLERVITVTKTFAPGESGIVCRQRLPGQSLHQLHQHDECARPTSAEHL
jgi:hypothetical protein